MKVLCENGSLTLIYTENGAERSVSFHDTVKKGGKRYCFFHGKTRIRETENGFDIRTAAVYPEDGEPLPGLVAHYTVTASSPSSAFYVSLEFLSDALIKQCVVSPFDVTFGDLAPESYVGYDYDAVGALNELPFDMPPVNPSAPSYEEMLVLRPHVAWERMKTRPKTFHKAITLKGKDWWLTVYGGSPTFNPEAQYVSVFTTFKEYSGDLRFFSGKSRLGAWFVPGTFEDAGALFDRLDTQVPVFPEVPFCPFAEEKLFLKSGRLTVSLKKGRSGIAVANVGREETDEGLAPLFELGLYDAEHDRTVYQDSADAWETVDVLERENYLRLIFKDPQNGRADGIRVICEAFCHPEQDRIAWKTRVTNVSERWAVREISYPAAPTRAGGAVYNSTASGNVDEQFAAKSKVVPARYPTGVRAPMAFVAFYDPVPLAEQKDAGNGLYLGIHDPEGCCKTFFTAASALSRFGKFVCTYRPDYEKRPGNSFALPGEEIWQIFSGDWYDASTIYKEFVRTKAEWFPHCKGRTDSPAWFRDIAVWMMHDLPIYNPDAPPFPVTLREKYPDKTTEDWYKDAIEFAEKLGVPTCYHLYNWHWIPFNNDNPNYFPVIPGLKQGLRELKQHNIRYIPYIAGYSWDSHDHRGGDFRFEEEALPNTAKDVNGSVISTSYASTEPDGKPVTFARMCPTTRTWKDEIGYIAGKLSSDYEADGIYLDVVSTAYEGCHDETHLHVPGQGAFWHRAYSDLIAEVRANVPHDFAVISESVSEVYMDSLDGFLAWTWVYTGLVPAYMNVYAGYGQFFGRVFTSNTRDDLGYFRFNLAHSLVYGQQLGWLHPELVHDEKQFPFVKKMAQIRYRYKDFFASAAMLRPAEVCCHELLDTEAFLRSQEYNHQKCIVSGSFEDNGIIRIFTVNTGYQADEFTLSLREDEYGSLENYELEGDAFTVKSVEKQKGVIRITCAAASEGYGIITVKRS